VPTKIKAVDEKGGVLAFDSIRAASRAGFTLSRVHKAIYEGQCHRKLRWYLSGELDALPAFMAATFDLTGKGWTADQEIHAAFRLVLAPDEDLGSGEWDFWEFQQALWRIISPRPYTKSGNVRGLWKGEHPKPHSEGERGHSDPPRGTDDACTRSEASEQR
jgi:hypothetical protein